MKKPQVTLFIDTADSQLTKISLEVGTERFIKTSHSRELKSQMVLPLIEALLDEHGVSFADLSAIKVTSQGTSFTGLRVGMAVAKTLGALLGIPVNGEKVTDKAQPLSYPQSKFDDK